MKLKRFFILLTTLAFLLPTLRLSGSMSCHGSCMADCCQHDEPMHEADGDSHSAESCDCLDCGCPSVPTLSLTLQIETTSPIPFNQSRPGVLHESTLEVLSPPPEL